MSSFKIADRARDDLLDIWFFIAERNPTAADRFLALLVQKFQLLADSPRLGRLREEFQPGLRSLPVRNYLIFYRPIRNGIEVIRVLHGARDLPTIFEGNG